MSKSEKGPMRPELTMQIKNEKLEELLQQYAADKTAENLGKLVTCIHHCRVLVPAGLNGKKQPIPCFIKNSDGGMYLPVFTSQGQIPEKPKSQAVMNMPYLSANQIALGQGAQGVVINPFSDNLVFKPQLLQRIAQMEKQLREGKAPVQKKTVKLTEAQYLVFERNQFEFRFLPQRFFGEGGSFIEMLCDKRGEYLDMLYEESFQQKRLYPYLPEEFSVMAMDISEELLVVSADLPARDLGENSCVHIYFAWNKQTQKGRYFTIEKSKAGLMVGEVASGGQHLSHGEAPSEGVQLQRIMELAEDERRHTS